MAASRSGRKGSLPIAGEIVGPPRRGSLLVAGQHFAAAIAYLVTGSLALIWIAPELAAGAFISPRVAGVTHLFTLGWLTMMIFGVLHRIIARALGTRPVPEWMGHASFWLFAPGVALFAGGISFASDALRHSGIALVTPGVLLAAAGIGRSVLRASDRDVTRASVLLAFCFLLAALAAGVLLLFNIGSWYLAEARLRVLAAHLHLALVGWVLVMIVGVSHRILPAVLASTAPDRRWTARSVVLLGAGVVLLVVGVTVPVPVAAWTGAAALEGGIVCFLWQVCLFYRFRNERSPHIGLKFAALGLACISVGAALGPFVLARGIGAPRLATVYVLVGLLGGIVPYVIGHFYRIFPNFVRSMNEGVGSLTPSPRPGDDRYGARIAAIQFAVLTAAVVALMAGILVGSALLVRGGASLYFAAVLLMLVQITRVVRAGLAYRT